jgi:hypothetical protein
MLRRPRGEPVLGGVREDFFMFTRFMPDGCIEWTGYINKHGYGHSYDPTEKRLDWAHRVSFQLFNGAIPAGLHIDHLCRNTRCVNPGHLEAVTPRINTLRGLGNPAINRRKTRCVNGHEFTEENTLTYRRNGEFFRRECRTCNREKMARYRADPEKGEKIRTQNREFQRRKFGIDASAYRV